MVANILSTDPMPRVGGRGSVGKAPYPRPLAWGQKVKIHFFSEYCHVAYQIKWNHECSNMVAKRLPAYTPDPGVQSKDQNSIFSEHGHVAYQIKRNHRCSNMVTNILPADPLPSDTVGGVNRSKFNFFGTWLCNISN